MKKFEKTSKTIFSFSLAELIAGVFLLCVAIVGLGDQTSTLVKILAFLMLISGLLLTIGGLGLLLRIKASKTISIVALSLTGAMFICILCFQIITTAKEYGIPITSTGSLLDYKKLTIMLILAIIAILGIVFLHTNRLLKTTE